MQFVPAAFSERAVNNKGGIGDETIQVKYRNGVTYVEPTEMHRTWRWRWTPRDSEQPVDFWAGG